MFIPDRIESDQHIASYRWLSEKSEPVHPPLYFIFFCPLCQYADAATDFTKPAESEYAIYILRQFKKFTERGKNVIEHLLQFVDYDNIDFCSALALHLLAAYEQLLPSADMQDNYKIGRLFLRIAWLFREAKASQAEEAEQKSAQTEEVSTQTGTRTRPVPGFVEQILPKIRPFLTALQNAETLWQEVGRHLQEHIGTEPSCCEEDETTRFYTQCQRDMEQLFAQQVELASQLRASLQVSLGENPGHVAAKIAPGSYESLLQSLRPLWPRTPINEEQALRSAAAYFQKALSRDLRFDNPQAHLTVISLVTDILIRCNDLDAAYDALRSMYKSNMDAIMQYNQALKDTEVSEERRKRIPALIKRATSSMESTAELRRSLLDMLMARDRPKIDQILQEHAGEPALEREDALEKSGIMLELITMLKRPGEPLEELGKRKRRL